MPTKCGTDNCLKKINNNPRSVNRRAANTQRLAETLYKLKCIQIAYALTDSFSTSYSAIKLIFDLLYTDSDIASADVMHDWLMTPGGIAAAATESITLITFSLLATIFSDTDKNALKRYIAISWPYVRDVIKVKNVYKGIRSTVQAYGMLAGQNIRYMIVPIGVVLGVLSIATRICMRSLVVGPRKDMMKANAELLLEIQGDCRLHLLSKLPDKKTAYINNYILVGRRLYYIDHGGEVIEATPCRFEEFLSGLKALNTDKKNMVRLSRQDLERLIQSNEGYIPPEYLDAAACAKFRRRVSRQSQTLSVLGLMGAAYCGVVDGLYLFMGVLGLAVLATPALLAMTIICTLFTAICVAVRVYEEYRFQRQLEGTQAKIELALLGRELEALFNTLQVLSNPMVTADTDDLAAKQQQTMLAFEAKTKEFERQQANLKDKITLSYKSAALAGLKNGLAAYGAIGSVMFVIAIFYAILVVPFPPAFVISCVIAGIACLIGFLTYSLVRNYQHLHATNKLKPEDKSNEKAKESCSSETLSVIDKPKTLFDISILLKRNKAAALDLKPTEVKEAILQGMVVDPSPQFFFEEGFEVVRALCAGAWKGEKTINLALNALLRRDQLGHYQETPVMLAFVVGSALIHGGAFALWAYARGFGRPDISNVRGKKPPEVAESQVALANVMPQQSQVVDDVALKKLGTLEQLIVAPPLVTDGESTNNGSFGQRQRPGSAHAVLPRYETTSGARFYCPVPSPSPTLKRSTSIDSLCTYNPS